MATTPSALALTTIADGSLMVASDERNNYTSIQTQFNALLTLLNAGTAAQFLQSGGGTTVSWAGAYTAYTPVWASSGTAVALGNGTITGSYIQIGKHVQGTILLTMGSTTTYGTGNYTLTLPVAAAGGTLTPLGLVSAVDSGVATYTATALLSSSTTVQLNTVASPNTLITATVPFTFATADLIVVNFSYQAS